MSHYGNNCYQSVKERKDALYYIRHFCRLFIGVLFIFSAYVKGVDPFGFALKIEEYFLSFGMNFLVPLSMFTACCMLLAEFLIGVAMLLNIQPRFFSWLLLLFMSFFLLLTAYLAFAPGIVRLLNRWTGNEWQIFVPGDCGCFGDFIKLTNTQTFLKNVVFMLPTLVVFAQRKRFRSQPFHYVTEWGPLVLASAFMIFMEVHCLRHEPWHDFRPWNKGHFIAAETYAEAPEKDFVFQYKNVETGELREITMDELMEISEDSLRNADLEEHYAYVSRVEKLIKPGVVAHLTDFTMMESESRKDVRQRVIESPDYQFIIFFRDVTDCPEKGWKRVNELATACVQSGISFSAVTASLASEVEQLTAGRQLPYTFYYSDATPMKTALRNNLGVLLLKEGYVLDKWSFRDVPTYEKFVRDMPRYEQALARYKEKEPPVLPNGEMLHPETAEDAEEGGEEADVELENDVVYE